MKRIMKRAGIVTPVKGAHALRHTAATEMLRHGVPLDKIGLVLRHRGIDTTAYYAKADIALLKQVAQPWPEARRCSTLSRPISPFVVEGPLPCLRASLDASS